MPHPVNPYQSMLVIFRNIDKINDDFRLGYFVTNQGTKNAIIVSSLIIL